ncbi:MAG: S8 family serine peptidase [Candidatus Poribacteria bacterium]|nr:hypothetical protein [Candidatus Poribacteria bacterium]
MLNNRVDDNLNETGYDTHVAGIISIQTNNRVAISGLANNCQIMPLRADYFALANVREVLLNDDVSDDIVYATNRWSHIANTSWEIKWRTLILKTQLNAPRY